MSTHSLTHLTIHSLIDPFTHPFTRSPSIHSPIQSSIYPPTYPLISLYIHEFTIFRHTHPFTYPSPMHSHVNRSIHAPTHPSIHPVSHSLTHYLSLPCLASSAKDDLGCPGSCMCWRERGQGLGWKSEVDSNITRTIILLWFGEQDSPTGIQTQ